MNETQRGQILKSINFVILTILIFFSTNSYAATFKGKVIDSDTKEPIEGAVVVMSWSEERATPAGPTSRLKDVKETLTDKNGMWLIKGPKGGDIGKIKAIFSFLTGTYFTNFPDFIIFKPGYCSWPEGFGIDACRGKMKLEGNDKVAEGVTVELPKLINRGDRLETQRIWPPLVGGDIETKRKMKNFIRLLNEERRHLGIPEDPTLKEIENEK